jgi:hypothetical protein
MVRRENFSSRSDLLSPYELAFRVRYPQDPAFSAPSDFAGTVPDAERRHRIDEIRGLLAAAVLAPKDLFLTQPPLPNPADETAYAAWQARERRRRPIAHRLSLYGLTAHDLAPA